MSNATFPVSPARLSAFDRACLDAREAACADRQASRRPSWCRRAMTAVVASAAPVAVLAMLAPAADSFLRAFGA